MKIIKNKRITKNHIFVECHEIRDGMPDKVTETKYGKSLLNKISTKVLSE